MSGRVEVVQLGVRVGRDHHALRRPVDVGPEVGLPAPLRRLLLRRSGLVPEGRTPQVVRQVRLLRLGQDGSAEKGPRALPFALPRLERRRGPGSKLKRTLWPEKTPISAQVFN